MDKKCVKHYNFNGACTLEAVLHPSQPPPWRKCTYKALASLLLALWRLFSSLLLAAAICLSIGLHILHSRYRKDFYFKINIKSTAGKILQGETMQETNVY
jgi:hypothetical protein